MTPTGTPSPLVIPADTQAAHAPLIDLIKVSESMNDEERQYWINILPVMTPEQLKNLSDILQNEKQQLADIDKKYAKEVDAIGAADLVAQTADEHRVRREKRQQAESQHDAQEDKDTEALLKQIEGNPPN